MENNINFFIQSKSLKHIKLIYKKIMTYSLVKRVWWYQRDSGIRISKKNRQHNGQKKNNIKPYLNLFMTDHVPLSVKGKLLFWSLQILC